MIKVIAGGKKNRDWLVPACEEYEKRLRKPFDLTWQFCDESEIEARVSALDSRDFVILLDENGKILSSPELSHSLDGAFVAGRNVVFVLGGAFGHFSKAILERANLVWSLSRLVFPHQICRLILAEQIYRAQEISLGHPYHHA